MNTLALNSNSYDFSTKITNIIELFSPENFSRTNLLFKKLDKKSEELYDLTIDVINSLDNEQYEKILEFKSIIILMPIVNLMKDMDIKFKTEKEKILLKKHFSTIIKFKKSIGLFSDFLEALNQYIEDKGKDKISYYIQLIDEYKNDMSDNLRLNEEFNYVNIEKWE